MYEKYEYHGRIAYTCSWVNAEYLRNFSLILLSWNLWNFAYLPRESA